MVGLYTTLTEAVFSYTTPKAKYLHRSEVFVKRWVEIHKSRQDKVIINLFKNKPMLTISQAQQFLMRDMNGSIIAIYL